MSKFGQHFKQNRKDRVSYISKQLPVFDLVSDTLYPLKTFVTSCTRVELLSLALLLDIRNIHVIGKTIFTHTPKFTQKHHFHHSWVWNPELVQWLDADSISTNRYFTNDLILGVNICFGTEEWSSGDWMKTVNRWCGFSATQSVAKCNWVIYVTEWCNAFIPERLNGPNRSVVGGCWNKIVCRLRNHSISNYFQDSVWTWTHEPQ